MPIRMHTGFETSNVVPLDFYDFAAVTGPVSQIIATDHAHSGTRSLKIELAANDDWIANGGTGGALKLARAVADEPAIIGCAFRTNRLDATNGVCIGISSDTSGTTQNFVYLAISADGSATLRGHGTYPGLSTSGTQLGSALAAGTFASNAWYYVEVRCESIHDTTGKAQVWVNGTLQIDFTGDTRYAANGTTGGILYGPLILFSTLSSVSGDTPLVWLDDVYAGDAMTVLGPVFHEALFPTSTIEAGGIGSDADSVDNHLLIDNYLGSGIDYVDFDSGVRGRYEFANRTLTGTVHAVSLHGAIANPDPGIVNSSGFILSGATEVNGATLIASSAESVTSLVGPLQTDPNTATGWTTPGINAITGGVEVV